MPHMLRKRPFEERAAFQYKHSDEGRQDVEKAEQRERERRAAERMERRRKERRKKMSESERASERGYGSGSGSGSGPAVRRVGKRRSMDERDGRDGQTLEGSGGLVSRQPLGEDNV